jgi:O-acetyl-ADP-ribose deacetylase (regulator of RNase III)
MSEPVLRVLQADLTRLAVDAVVNAANERMLGGGGVDGAIHRAAGPRLRAACEAHPEIRPGVRCPTGEARLTEGFELPARYVIHTVGPVWHGGARGEAELLARCYRSAMQLAQQQQLSSIAFPAISCGIYGYPLAEAARIAVRETSGQLSQGGSLSDVILVGFDEAVTAVLRQALEQFWSPEDSD